jgi:DNA-binding response OmpR family regulator
MLLLLAEDNPGDALLVREALRTSSIPSHLVIAEDGEQALNRLRSSQFDLVILDLNLPRLDGLEILQLCGSAESAPPFVIFSSSSRQSDRELALLLGAKDYVVKPIHLQEFVAAVHGIIDRWGNRLALGVAPGE